MKTYEKCLIKEHSLPIEKIPIYTNQSEAIASLKIKLHVETPNNQNNSNIVHHVSQERTIFGHKKPLKYLTTLHAKVKT